MATILAGLLFVLGYIALEAKSLFKGAILEIENPKNGDVVTDSLQFIYGRTENVILLSINDLEIFVDEEGRFREPVLLAPGYNIIEVALKNKFGRVDTKYIELIYKK